MEDPSAFEALHRITKGQEITPNNLLEYTVQLMTSLDHKIGVSGVEKKLMVISALKQSVGASPQVEPLIDTVVSRAIDIVVEVAKGRHITRKLRSCC
jgi:hypothetical protein